MSDLQPQSVLQLLLNPSEQARELQSALSTLSGAPGNAQVSRRASSRLFGSPLLFKTHP